MNPSEAHHSDPLFVPTGGDGPSLELLAIDFIDVNRSLTLATQLANLARLWTHQAHQAPPAGLSGLGAIAGEIDRLLLDCQYLLPRLAEIVDRYPTEPDTGPKSPPTGSAHGLTILIDGAPASLRPQADREYGGDLAVAAADLASRAVLAAESHRLQLWQEFGRIARNKHSTPLWQDHDVVVTYSFAPVSLRTWLPTTAQTIIAWFASQFGIP